MAPAFRQALMAWQQKDSTEEYSGFFHSVLVAAGIPESHVPEDFGDDLVSPVLRTYVLLAALILHELTHAFGQAYYDPDHHLHLEPFIEGFRANELGFAAERYILGGITRPSGFLPAAGLPPSWGRHIDAYATFGLYTNDTWAQWLAPGTSNRTLEEGKDADFAAPIRAWPVAQRQVYDYFTDEMWKKKVPRYGLGALKYVKIPEWAVSRMPGPDPAYPGVDNTLR